MARVVSALLLILICLGVTPSRAFADPDPVALLRGVEAAREAWRGRFAMSTVSEGIRPKKPMPRRIRLQFDFDREKRRVIQEETTFIINAPKAGQNPTPGEQVKAMGWDLDRAVKQGLARWVEVRSRAAYDGAQVCTYNELGSVAIDDPKEEPTTLCFDPRVLGLVGNPSLRSTLAYVLGTRNAKSVRLIGQDMIRGHRVWQVAVEWPGVEGSSWNFWIEDREGFRVHRFLYQCPAEKPEQETWDRAELFYESGGTFPIRVEMERFAPNIHYKVTDVVEKLELGVKPDPEVFGLAGLDIPPGEMITDNRILQVVGYWDGKGITKERSQAVKQAAALAAGPHWSERLWMPVAGVLAFGLLVLGVRYYRRSRSAGAP